MNMQDIRKKNTAELTKMVDEKSKALKDFRFGISGSKIKNIKEGKNLKKEIAQILTVINESKKKSI